MPLILKVLVSKSFYNRANFIIKYQIVVLRERFFQLTLATAEETFFIYLGGERSTLLVCNLRVRIVFRQIQITGNVFKLPLC